MHAYDETHLKTRMDALGKAFEFAEAGLAGGSGRFYRLFVNSDAARGFGPGADQQEISASGIALVLDVCGETEEMVDPSFGNNLKIPRGRAECARWCGTALAYFQWWCGLPFRAIGGFLSIEDLEALYAPGEPVDSPEVIARLDELRRAAATSTKLQTRRLERGLTQAELAEASGVSLRAIQQYEQRQKSIDRARAISVYRLAQALDCHIEELLEFE